MRTRGEDADRTVIFVDVLGFAALTEKFRTRVIDSEPDEHGFEGSSTSPIQNRINRFHRVVDQCVFEQSLFGSANAMLFSDCAFLEVGTSLLTAVVAAELMRNCLKNHVPVRMGIGKGTFYPLTFSTDLTGSVVVSRSRFIGTAVVRAHKAEQCGGKGMRIFLHPSMQADLGRIQERVRTMNLPKRYSDARWELDYLHERRPAQEAVREDEADRELFEAVAAMKDPTATIKIRRQYTETHNALNRMRQANSRKRISTTRMRTACSIDDVS